MRAPALVPAIALICGTLAGIAWTPAPDLQAVLSVVGITSSLLWLRRQNSATCAALTLGYALCGVQLGAVEARRAIDTPVRAALDATFGGFRVGAPGAGGAHPPLIARGRLLEDAAIRGESVSLRLALQAITLPGRGHPPWLTHAVSGSVLVSVNGAAAPHQAEQWRAGRTLTFPATFRRPARYLNEGVSDFERESALGGITLGGTSKSALLVEVVGRGSAIEELSAGIRARVRRSVARWMDPRDPLGAAIVTAILIGDRTGLPADLRDRLQAAGTYHVIAISGGNIAILAGLLMVVLTAVGIRPRARALLVIAGLVAYATVVTSGPSVWRATTTAAAYLTARAWDHRSPPWNAAAVSAALLVCVSPLDVRDVGFALTFGATCALIAIAERVPSLPALRSLPAVIRWPLITVLASVAVQAVLMPVEARTFSRVSVFGIVLNLAALPLMTVAQVAGMAMAGAPTDHVARAAAWAASMSTSGLVWSAGLIDVLPALTRHVPPPSIAVVTIYYLVLALAVTTRGHRRWISTIVFLPLAGLIVTGHTGHPRQPAAGRLSLTTFDVGQGDAMLLTLPDGSHTMVDAGGIGYGESSFDIGTRVLEPALWARGVYGLSALTLTHGDPDHIGGAAALVRDLRPLAMHEGVRVARHVPSRALIEAAGRLGVPVRALRRGDEWSAAGARVRVLHPPEPDWERPRVRNDDSIVLEVLYGDVALLLTGDAGVEVEREILPLLSPARIRILKVGHHGSRTSTSQGLLDAWRPDIAVISCGRGNPFGHPHPDVLARLAGVGAKILRTDLHGEVAIHTDGREVSLRTFTGST